MLEIIFRDTDLLVVNKPSNVSLLADRTGAPNLWDEIKKSAKVGKPYLVHRLDKGTSGVLLIALNQRTQTSLTKAIQQHQVDKFYVAWVTGSLNLAGSGHIELPLKKGRKSRYRVAGLRSAIVRHDRHWRLEPPGDGGHPSHTKLRLLRNLSDRSLVLLKPTTGRTHQLRVHLAWIGHPVLGDSLYGKPQSIEQQAPRLQLHCQKLVVPGWGRFLALPEKQGWLGSEDLP
ncbi:MAG: RNA pseudouridine synthase [Gammaproteobacteria bacterium]|nr:RNA pseudouridine synthase [Gammaproteobacteria bacterium]